MLCCDVRTKIQPEDILFSSSQEKFIKVKSQKEIHLVHLNENKQLLENEKSNEPNFDKATLTFTEQPKRLNNPVNNTVFDKQNEPKSNKDINDNSNKSNILNLNFENFRSLIESDLFEKSSTKNINHLIGKNTNRLAIVYKNFILNKPDETSAKNKLPLLFFIHGVGGNSLIWKNQLKYFGELGYEIIAIDLMGHGKSTKSKEKSHYEFVEMFADILTIFDIYAKEDNIIIGHSYGCSFAVNLSQIRKNCIKKIVLISGGLPYPLNYYNPILNAPIIFFKLLKPFIDCHFFCSAFSPNFKDKYKETFQITAESLFYTMNGQFWQPCFIKSEYFKGQKCLLIEGGDDKFVPNEDAFEMLKTLENSYFVTIEKGSHMVLLEEPDVINKLIDLFFNDPIF